MSPDSKQNPVLAILERLPVGTFISSAETGKIIWANARDLRLVGAREPGQVIGRNLMDFVVPEEQGAALAGLEAITRGESPPPTVYQVRRVDGGFASLRVASVGIWLDGAPAMLSLISDVTEEHEALRACAESEDRYRQLVESVPDGIVVIAHGTIAYANPALVRMLGYASADDMIGVSMYDFIAEEQRDEIRARRRKLLSSGEATPPQPLVLIRADGTTLETTSQSTLVQWQGEASTQTIIRTAEKG